MSSNILTVNPGSTAVKYMLFGSDGKVLDERVFDRKSVPEAQSDERTWLSGLAANNEEGVGKVSMRIVHGGDIAGPKVLDTETKMQTREYAKFAPIHNNLALEVVSLLQEVLPSAEIIASFDTDFHTTMPLFAKTYPINKKLADKHNIKRYGFHGLALRSVLQQLEKLRSSASKSEKVICVHLGGGCSVTAVKSGESVDTTMGLTPLEGIMMITRSGSIDPSMVAYIGEKEGLTAWQVVEMLNNDSGLYGMTGSKNTLDIIERASKHQEPEKLAFDIFVSQIVKQIFAYYGTLQGCDALTFSGGIGYGNAYLRSRVLRQLKIIGITEQNSYAIKANEARVLFDNAKT